VNYNGLSVVLLEAVKELRRQNADLAQKIKTLEERVDARDPGKRS
jgi:hypothetical protein